MQVRGVQAFGCRDRDRGVRQRVAQWRDDVAVRYAPRLEHDDDLTGRAAQPGVQRFPGTEDGGGADELVGGPDVDDLRSGHHHDLGVCGPHAREDLQRGAWRRAAVGDHDHGGRRRGGLVKARGDRPCGAVEGAFAIADVSRTGRLQVVAGAEVDDLPAGRLDARLELIGGAIVTLDAGLGALVRERDDVVGY